MPHTVLGTGDTVINKTDTPGEQRNKYLTYFSDIYPSSVLSTMKKNKGEKNKRKCHCQEVVREGLPEEVTSEQRPNLAREEP